MMTDQGWCICCWCTCILQSRITDTALVGYDAATASYSAGLVVVADSLAWWACNTATASLTCKTLKMNFWVRKFKTNTPITLVVYYDYIT